MPGDSLTSLTGHLLGTSFSEVNVLGKSLDGEIDDAGDFLAFVFREVAFFNSIFNDFSRDGSQYMEVFPALFVFMFVLF